MNKLKIMGTFVVLLLLSSYATGMELRVGMDGSFIPQKDSVYISGALPLDQHPYYYITSFTPVIKLGNIHHFGIFGCREPGSTAKLWNSNNNIDNIHQDGLPVAALCKDSVGAYLMYAWSYNSSSVTMPEDVAFQVGWDTDARYLVFEIHYPHVSAYKDGVGDDSHVLVKYQLQKTRYAAGYLATAPVDIDTPLFPPHQKSTLDFEIFVANEIHPFVYKVHTHLIGTKVSAYDIKYNASNPEDMVWTQIGMRDPMIPQKWVPVDNNVTMEPGDLLAVRCTYYNFRDTPTKIGSSEETEMCNFYIMYWAEWKNLPEFSAFPLELQFPFKELGLRNIPEDA